MAKQYNPIKNCIVNENAKNHLYHDRYTCMHIQNNDTIFAETIKKKKKFLNI